MGYERKQYVGNATDTTLGVLIDADDLTIVLADATNYPTGGANGRFVLAIGWETDLEEKVLCESRVGTTVTVATGGRGHDGTTPQAHAAGVPIAHVWDAESADQVNRYANLQTGKGDIVVHNGVNPVRLGTLASDAGDDGKVLQLAWDEPTGLIFDAVATVYVTASAPAVDGAVRLWYDTANRQLRPSDSTNWLTPVQLPAFASRAAAMSYFDEAIGCAYYNTVLGFAELYTGSAWIPMWRPRFADGSARDSYYASPYDGAQAYLTGSHEEQVYRFDKWVTISNLVTVSDTPPAGALPGDIWLEPVT